MLKNNFIIVTALVATLTACGGGSSYDSTNPNPNPNPVSSGHSIPGPTDIGKMPLSQALPTKYSRLQLICVTNESEPIGTLPSGSGGTVSDSGRVLKWDLLKQPMTSNTITFHEGTGRVRYDYSVVLNEGLETGTFETDQQPGKMWLFKKAARLAGTVSGTIQFLDSTGQVVGSTAKSETPDNATMEENIEALVTSVNMTMPTTGEKYSLTIKCTLEGDVKAAFASDTTVLKTDGN